MPYFYINAVLGARRLFYSKDAPVPQNGGDVRALQARMLGILKDDPGMAVSDLAAIVGVTRQVALNHVRKLAQARLVRFERRMARLRAYPVRPASR